MCQAQIFILGIADEDRRVVLDSPERMARVDFLREVL